MSSHTLKERLPQRDESLAPRSEQPGDGNCKHHPWAGPPNMGFILESLLTFSHQREKKPHTQLLLRFQQRWAALGFTPACVSRDPRLFTGKAVFQIVLIQVTARTIQGKKIKI